jgi:hypothetical protein
MFYKPKKVNISFIEQPIVLDVEVFKEDKIMPQKTQEKVEKKQEEHKKTEKVEKKESPKKIKDEKSLALKKKENKKKEKKRILKLRLK